jgi:outer membrane protein assembly factor BamE (lipoprotein component of BamABCDE complex)
VQEGMSEQEVIALLGTPGFVNGQVALKRFDKPADRRK